MRIRKQVYELTPDDLAEYPAWEFALDEEGEKEQDEATVRPIEQDGPIDPSRGMCIARTAFTLNDGTELTGFLSPQVPDMPNLFPIEGDDRSASTQPTIVTGNGHVIFWFGILKPTPEVIANNYRVLGGKSPEDVFPIRFSTDISIASGPVEGEIKGFMYVAKEKRGFLKRARVIKTILE